jgi:hypothetical protein
MLSDSWIKRLSQDYCIYEESEQPKRFGNEVVRVRWLNYYGRRLRWGLV